MKAFGHQEKFLKSLRTPASVEKWCRDQGNSKMSYRRCTSLAPANSSPEHVLCRGSRQEFEEVGLTSRSQTLAKRAAFLPDKLPHTNQVKTVDSREGSDNDW